MFRVSCAIGVNSNVYSVCTDLWYGCNCRDSSSAFLEFDFYGSISRSSADSGDADCAGSCRNGLSLFPSKQSVWSYYEKKFIPTSLAVLILSRYTKKNYLKYVNCILDLYNRNVLKYGNIVPDDEKICDIDKFKDSCEYMSEFKKRTKNIRIKK